MRERKNKADKVASSDRYGKGIVLFAWGHPYYSHMAFNLLCSLKVQSPEIEVTLVKHGNCLSQLFPEQIEMFDRVIELDDRMINGKYGYDPLKPKLHLDEITPYAKTLFLDVDMLWSPKKSATDLINSLQGESIAIANRGRIKTGETFKSRWVSLEHLTEQLSITEAYDVSSELIYFEESGDRVFKHARDIYESGLLTVADFAGGKPDEVFITAALEKENITLKQSPWYPTYWQPVYFHDKKKMYSDDEIREGFYALSSGGAFVARNVKRLYDIWAAHYYNMMGIRKTPYQLQPKSAGVPHRTKI